MKSVILPAELNEPSASTKRSHEDEKMEIETSTSSKKICSSTSTGGENSTETVVSVEHILNFPLPGGSGCVCHVKMYKGADDIKLNDLCEFVGFLSQDPLLPSNDGYESVAEAQTHNPPASLIPRIHCVGWKRLTHCNPLVGTQKFTSEKMKYLRGELLIVLTQILFGDKLAAEYLLYHLISSV